MPHLSIQKRSKIVSLYYEYEIRIHNIKQGKGWHVQMGPSWSNLLPEQRNLGHFFLFIFSFFGSVCCKNNKNCLIKAV